MKSTQKREILKIQGDDGNFQSLQDEIAEERKLLLKVNGREVLSLLCTPTMVRELVVGFLVTEGLIDGSFCAERMSIEYQSDEVIVDVPAEGNIRQGQKTITSGCVGGLSLSEDAGKTKVNTSFKVKRSTLFKLFKVFQERSHLYHATGCVHSAAISDGRSILVVAEDIGRHNAVDKAIGYCVLEGIGFDDKIILVSGRLSSEMVKKAAKAGIPVVASRTAPTTRAIDMALSKGLTLVGFMRGKRFNVYSGYERII